jgi:rhodanese-related sulfurtransferase
MAYTEKFVALATAARARVQEVTPDQVDGLVAGGAVLVDIRDKEEFDEDRIPGAVNVSRGTLEMRIESVVPDLDATVLCYCNANHRGALSTDTLRAMGYKNARLIVGGLRGYRAAADARRVRTGAA